MWLYLRQRHDFRQRTLLPSRHSTMHRLLVLCLLVIDAECQEPPSIPPVARPSSIWDCDCYPRAYRVSNCASCPAGGCSCCYPVGGGPDLPLCPTPSPPPPVPSPTPDAPPVPPRPPRPNWIRRAPDSGFPAWAIVIVVTFSILLIISVGGRVFVKRRSASNVPTASGVAFHDVAAAPVVPAHVVTATVVAKDDPAEKIKKLKSLHDQGLITDQEFADKKAELLDRM